jgi:hypothetical protein
LNGFPLASEFGKYRMLERIGQRAFIGPVYLAHGFDSMGEKEGKQLVVPSMSEVRPRAMIERLGG